MAENHSEVLKRIKLNEREIILLGTAHVSKESIKQVEDVIRAEKPDCVCVELDDARYKTLTSEQTWQEINIAKVLKEGKGFLLLANLVLASFQKRLGSNIGVKPGFEMKAAITTAEELNIRTELADRPIHITLKRAWAKSGFLGRAKLLAALLSSAFSNEKLDESEIEVLKNKSAMDNMMKEMADYLPNIKEVLIDERDKYLASKIWEAKGEKTVAVLGAGHLSGTEQFIRDFAANLKNTDISDISEIPPKSVLSKIAAWIFPIAIISVIIAGFFKDGSSTTSKMLFSFILWNGGLSAIGALAALGHPLAILTSFIGAPITTINPFLGIGLISGLVQAWAKKPQVRDMENLMTDSVNLRGWYKNKITKVLLVFILSSLGSSIGTFITVPALIAKLFS